MINSIIDLMGRYYERQVSEEVINELFRSFTTEIRTYIAKQGYEVVKTLPEHGFNLDEISDLFSLFTETADPTVIQYSYKVFYPYLLRKWGQYKRSRSGLKSAGEFDANFRDEYLTEAYFIFMNLFLYCTDGEYAPQAFLAWLNARIDSNLAKIVDKQIFGNTYDMLSLDIELESGITLADTIADDNANIPGPEDHGEIDRLLSCLTRRQANVVILHLGLYGENEMTYDEIAARLNISPKTVARDYATAKIKMENFLNLDRF